MGGSGIESLLIYILAPQVILWSLVYWRLRRQAEDIRSSVSRSGENLIIPPGRANYQGWTRRFGRAKSMGRIALTNRRIIFRRPIGREINIALDEIMDVSGTAHAGRISHTFGNYLVLKLRDDTEVVFIVPDQALWIREVRQATRGVTG